MDKPDALRLADELDEPEYLMQKQAAEAAAELRRLHAQRDALLEAFYEIRFRLRYLPKDIEKSEEELLYVIRVADAAITKMEQTP